MNFLLVRAFCDVCGQYGRCAVAFGFDGREIYIGIDCGCLQKDIKKKEELRKKGSPYVSYA